MTKTMDDAANEAAGMSYTLYDSEGKKHVGTFDKKGHMFTPNLPKGPCHGHIGNRQETQKKLLAIHKQLKQELEALLQEEIAFNTREQGRLAHRNLLGKVTDYGKLAGEGVATGAKESVNPILHVVKGIPEGLFHFFKAMVLIVGREDMAAHSAQFANMQMIFGNQSEAQKTLNRAQAQTIKDGEILYGPLTESIDDIHTLLSDPTTKKLLWHYAKAYYHNSSAALDTRATTEIAGAAVPAIVVALMTRHITLIRKVFGFLPGHVLNIGELLRKEAHLLRRWRYERKFRGETNTTITVNVPPEKVDLEDLRGTAGETPGNVKSSEIAPGTYRPVAKLPRAKHGEPIPYSDLPHSQIGTQTSRKVGEYTQAREWGYDSKGQLVPKKVIDFTDHGRPGEHTSPHQHRMLPNKTGGTLTKGGPEPLALDENVR